MNIFEFRIIDISLLSITVETKAAGHSLANFLSIAQDSICYYSFCHFGQKCQNCRKHRSLSKGILISDFHKDVQGRRFYGYLQKFKTFSYSDMYPDISLQLNQKYSKAVSVLFPTICFKCRNVETVKHIDL